MQLNGNLSSSRYEWVPDVLPSLLGTSPSDPVLDIGAGDARMRTVVESSGAVYRGYDLFPAAPEIDRWDLDQPAPAAWPRGGGALLLDVIEHCNNPGLALGHVSDALLPGAFLVLTTPNPKWSRARLTLVATGSLNCFTQDDLELNHHVFTPWPHILERLLADAGFRVEVYTTLDGLTQWPGRPFGLRYPLRFSVAAALRMIERRDPSACGMSYGLIARKQAQGPGDPVAPGSIPRSGSTGPA